MCETPVAPYSAAAILRIAPAAAEDHDAMVKEKLRSLTWFTIAVAAGWHLPVARDSDHTSATPTADERYGARNPAGGPGSGAPTSVAFEPAGAPTPPTLPAETRSSPSSPEEEDPLRTLSHGAVSGIPAVDDPAAITRRPGGSADPDRASPPGVPAPPARTAGANGRITQAEIDELESGLQNVLPALDASLADEVLRESLPLVGPNFAAAWNYENGGFRFLRALQIHTLHVLAGLNHQPDYDPAALASSLKSRLTVYGGFPTSMTVMASTAGDQARISYSFSRGSDPLNVPIAADLGLPNLALRLEGTPVARTSVTATMALAFGVDADGFYLDTEGAQFQLATHTTISALDAAGTFAGLPCRFIRNAADATAMPAQFLIVMKEPGGDGRLRPAELAGDQDLLDATVDGTARVTVKMESSLPPEAMAPRAGSDLLLLWAFPGEPVSPDDDNTGFGEAPEVQLLNNRVNLDSFFNSFAGRVLQQIDAAVEPFRPVVDVLATPIPLLSDLGSAEVTFMDILGVPDEAVAAIGGLDGLADLAALSGTFVVPASAAIDLGDYSLFGADLRTDDLEDLRGTPTRFPSASRPSSLTTFMNAAAGVPGLAFPLLEDPDVAARLMLGREAELFSYRSGEIGFSESFQQFYPVLGPVGVTLGGSLGLKTQFGFGYDTRGLLDYQAAGATDPELLLNGFYAMALDDGGNPLTGILLEAGVTAGLEVNVLLASAGIEGDLTATIGIYLDDRLGDHHGRIRGDVFRTLPMDEWFYAAGSLSAGLHAYLEVGWPPFGVSFDFDSPRVTLISFDSRDQTTPVLAEPGGCCRASWS